MRLDLSVGQRLAIGFALLLVLLGAAFFGVSRAVDASARAQAVFRQNIVPLRHHATELERALYQLSIVTRAFIIWPDDANADNHRSAVTSVSAANHALRNAPKDDLSEGLYRGVDPLVAQYIAVSKEVMDERQRRPLGLTTERALRTAHEKAIQAIRGFSQYQDSRARLALAEIAQKRDTVTTDLRLAFVLAAVLFVGVAFMTVQSIRRPARELVELARGFESGAWQSALRLRDAEAEHMPRETRDEMSRLRRAFAGAAVALEKREQRLHAEARVAAAAGSTLNKAELADLALMTIAEHVGADAAALYLLDGEILEPVATYAIDPPEASRLGVGLPGQAAKSQRPVFVELGDEPAPLQIKLGFADAPARTLGALPLSFRHEVIGVLLIGAVRPFDETDRAFLRTASAQVAIGLRNALTHEELQRVSDRLRTHGPESLQARK